MQQGTIFHEVYVHGAFCNARQIYRSEHRKAGGSNMSAVIGDEHGNQFPTHETLRQANLKFGIPTRDGTEQSIPRPAAQNKNKIFALGDFMHIDDRSCKAPPTLLDQPLEHLVRYLIDGTTTELQRVRAIYRWITAQNLNSLDSRAVNSNSQMSTAMEYLVAIRSNSGDYHTLMAAMCSCANVVTKKLVGHVKGSKYEIGEPLSNLHRSTWMAVYIDNIWYLLDVLWSSKYVSGELGQWLLIDDNGQGFKDTKRDPITDHYKYNEHYFLTNPEEFIHSHLPDDGSWQLLARKVSSEEFPQMAYLKPDFFNCRLQLISHKKCKIEAPEGLFSVTLGYEESDAPHFAYRLWISETSVTGQTQSEMFKDIALTRFVFMQNRDGKVTCDIRFPTPGKYKLEMFCSNDSSSPACQFVCAYVILAARAATISKPFPKNSRLEWGPGKDLAKVGLVPLTNQDGFIKALTGEIQISFRVKNSIQIKAKLHSDKKTAEDLLRYVLHYIQGDDLIILVKLIDVDDYVLNLYVGQDSKGITSLSNVCSYMISSLQPAKDTTPFPPINNGRLGPPRSLSVFEIKPVSEPAAIVAAPIDGTKMDFTFNQSTTCRLLAKLKCYRDDMEYNLNEYVFVSNPSKDLTSISARFPKTGQYVLSIFGKNDDDDDYTNHQSASYDLIFTYMIRVARATTPCFQFPTVFEAWTPRCQLLEPDINCPIMPESTIRYRVKIPNALKVAVVGSDGAGNNKPLWTYLVKHGDQWTGEVKTGFIGDLLKLYSNFDEKSTSYNCLMQFQVQLASVTTSDVAERKGHEETEATPVVERENKPNRRAIKPATHNNM